MLILSRKVNQEIVFPTIGVTLEVTRLKGSTVCLGIQAPEEIPILRGELHKDPSTAGSSNATAEKIFSHALRNRLNSLGLCLQLMKERQAASMPIDDRILARALYDLHTVEELMACDSAPNPFVRSLDRNVQSPFVMLIDDAVNESQLLASYLRHLGIQVALSNDGDAALSLLACIPRKPNVILLDMVMPGKDGLSTLRSLRENPAYDSIKVFAVTGLSTDSIPVSKHLAVDHWFQKPVQPEQLVKHIRDTVAMSA